MATKLITPAPEHIDGRTKVDEVLLEWRPQCDRTLTLEEALALIEKAREKYPKENGWIFIKAAAQSSDNENYYATAHIAKYE